MFSFVFIYSEMHYTLFFAHREKKIRDKAFSFSVEIAAFFVPKIAVYYDQIVKYFKVFMLRTLIALGTRKILRQSRNPQFHQLASCTKQQNLEL